MFPATRPYFRTGFEACKQTTGFAFGDIEDSASDLINAFDPDKRCRDREFPGKCNLLCTQTGLAGASCAGQEFGRQVHPRHAFIDVQRAWLDGSGKVKGESLTPSGPKRRISRSSSSGMGCRRRCSFKPFRGLNVLCCFASNSVIRHFLRFKRWVRKRFGLLRGWSVARS